MDNKPLSILWDIVSLSPYPKKERQNEIRTEIDRDSDGDGQTEREL